MSYPTVHLVPAPRGFYAVVSHRHRRWDFLSTGVSAYGIQITSMLIYTAAVALYTFSRNRNGAQPFLLSCPVVRRQLPRLVRRHLGFLAALLVAQTMALNFRPNLPAHLVTPSSRDPSPFALILGVLCLCLAIVQILTNRSLLDRAHDSAQDVGQPCSGEILAIAQTPLCGSKREMA